MDGIVQAILNNSVLELEHIKITDATSDTFVMSIVANVTKTGPLGATMSAMTVDMLGPGGLFGRLDLPEIKTSSKGTVVTVTNQKIAIVDHDAFLAFVRAIQLDDAVTLHLDNGHGKVRSWGVSANIVYKKQVDIRGMRGPRAELVRTQLLPGDRAFRNTVKISNPSPLEIDFGNATFEFRDVKAGTVLAKHSGRLHIPRGESMLEMTGTALASGNVDEVRLVGTDVEADAWSKEAIKFFDTPVTLTPELVGLVKA